MPRTRITELKVLELLDAEKVITANLAWKPLGRRAQTLFATVLALESKELLKIHGYVSAKESRNRSLALVYNGVNIRRVCLSPISRHRNPDGELLNGLHKHRFDEIYEDRMAYVPIDITKTGDVNREFLDFLTECKIRLEGAYQGWMQL